MAQISIDGLRDLLQEVFAHKQGLKDFLQVLLERLMAAEVSEHLQAERHQRSPDRCGHRNGYKPRSLNTRVGQLQLSVPQTRSCEPYHPSLWTRWQRSERALLVACGEMYFQGVSTRKVQEVLESMCDGEISAMTVSRVAQELDEKLQSFRMRRLEQTSWPYLMIDARYEKVRVEGKVLSQAVLVVIGFDSRGRREILDWRVGDSESESTWGQMFLELKDRGLRGVKLVVSDAHGGIRAALRRHFQGAAWQRCRVHFQRELGRKVSYKRSKELMKDLAALFAPEDKPECLRRAEEMACKWEGSYPQVAKMLREGLEDCLTVLSFPAGHRRRLRSTNLAENLMKQLKHRTTVVGVFPNRSSCDRLIGAMLVEIHEDWQVVDEAWLNMEGVE
jgi:putative transposase